MLEFRVKNIVPPGGEYFFEIEGVPVRDATMTGLLIRATREYETRGGDAPADLRKQVEHFMCQRLPNGFCTGTDDDRPRPRVITIHDVRRNTEELVKRTQAASPHKAKFQARKCNQCKFNNRSMCSTCSGINAWAGRRVGRPDNPAEFNWLGICEIDGTALVAKVNRTNVPDNDDYPDEGCWVREAANADA